MSRRMIRRLRSTNGLPVIELSIWSRVSKSNPSPNFSASSSCHCSTKLPGATMRQRSKSPGSSAL